MAEERIGRDNLQSTRQKTNISVQGETPPWTGYPTGQNNAQGGTAHSAGQRTSRKTEDKYQRIEVLLFDPLLLVAPSL